MNRDDTNSLEFSESRAEPSDPKANFEGSLRRGGSHPYRDRRDDLVERRRAIKGELARIEAAAQRSAKLRAHLRVLDDELQSSSRPLIERLRIASPCRARWDDMVGDDVSRHCARCDRDVFDISAMTRAEVEALFASSVRTPCVRLMRRPDGRVVTADCPAEPKLGALRVLRVAAAGVMLGATAGATFVLAAETQQQGEVPVAMTPARGPRAARRPIPHGPSPIAVRPGAFMPDLPPEVDHDTGDREGTMGTPVFDDVDPRDDGPRGPSAAEIARRVRAVDEHTWEIDRDFAANVLANPAALMRLARVIPHEIEGHVVGLKIYGIRRSSTLGRLGLQNGDMLLAINEYDLTSQEPLLETYSRLRGSEVLALLLARRGEARVHTYRIVDHVDTSPGHAAPRLVLPRPRRARAR